ncbi:MAG: hypothetical protein EBS37_05950, partial [Betaproteobacteria bacterium]|nr:hypothetical protein [Betaproteobacteria bacterium]
MGATSGFVVLPVGWAAVKPSLALDGVFQGQVQAAVQALPPTGTELAFARQEPQLGTGHAVQQALPQLGDDSITLILSGDVPLTQPETLRALLALCQGLFLTKIEHPEAELASAQVYNDWLNGFLGGHLDTFVRCGILPVHDFKNTVSEIKRLAGLGFTAAMLPSLIEQGQGIPFYNNEAWDPVFEAAQQHGVVMVLHTGTGREDVRAHKGPGGA